MRRISNISTRLSNLPGISRPNKFFRDGQGIIRMIAVHDESKMETWRELCRTLGVRPRTIEDFSQDIFELTRNDIPNRLRVIFSGVGQLYVTVTEF